MTCRSCSMVGSCPYILQGSDLSITRRCDKYIHICSGCSNEKHQHEEGASLGKLIGEVIDLKLSRIRNLINGGSASADVAAAEIELKQKQIDALFHGHPKDCPTNEEVNAYLNRPLNAHPAWCGSDSCDNHVAGLSSCQTPTYRAGCCRKDFRGTT